MNYIFNSLGSNYTFSFVLHAILYFFIVPPKGLVMDQLDHQLRQRFPNFELGPYYFYKGRDALEFVLTAFAIAADEPILTQAFTCHAMEAAIRRAGGLPAYVDLDETTCNPTVETIERAYKRNSTARVLIIQHTLGIPADIQNIRKWCDEHKIMLIEDLAQSIGGRDERGELLGQHADAIIFSFGRDKIIDSVSGGACFVKKRPLGFKNENYRTLTSTRFRRDHGYPLLTYCIRSLYPFYVGQAFLYLARLFHLIQSPIKPRFEYITAYPSALAALAVRQFERLDAQLEHRKNLAQLYYTQLGEICPVEWDLLERGSNLRFPISLNNPDKLLRFLATKHIYVQDRWYRKPVDSGSLQYFSKYRAGSCPVAEKYAATMVNLPTHQNITQAQAQYICHAIREYLAKEKN